MVAIAEKKGHSPLGNTTKFLSTFADAMIGKWALQAASRALLPRERVATCMRSVLGTSVGVLWAEKFQSASYCNLMVCGSVWTCPVCAAKITERRKVELEQAVKACNENNGSVYMQTFTFSHRKMDDLKESLAAFKQAREDSRKGRAGIKLREDHQILGTISCLEVTWSAVNGWHPHQHELVFFGEKDIDATAYERAMCSQWEKAIIKNGLRINKHGYKFDQTYGGVADYIAKWGHEPNGPVWGVEAELTKGHLKKGKGVARSYTPFGLLQESFNGNAWASNLFVEYASAFKGRSQLRASQNLKAQLGLKDEEKSDIELAEEQIENQSILGFLSLDQWRFVLANDARCELLLEVKGSFDNVERFLLELGWEGENA